MRPSRDVLLQARDLVARRLGLDFPEDRLPELARALGEAAGDLRLRSLEAFLALLSESPETGVAWRELTSRVTVKETYFFRDAACFQALEQTVLPGLVQIRWPSWSTGCSPTAGTWEVTVLATDIDVKALAAARRGRCRGWSFGEKAPSLRDASLVRRSSGHVELDPRIRGMVSFEPDNVSSGGFRGTIDLILLPQLDHVSRSERGTSRNRALAPVPGRGRVVRGVRAEAPAERSRPLVP